MIALEIGWKTVASIIECLEYAIVLHIGLVGWRTEARKLVATAVFSMVVVVMGNSMNVPHILKSVVVLSMLTAFVTVIYRVPVYLAVFYTIAIFYIYSIVALITGNLYSGIFGRAITNLIEDDGFFVMYNATAQLLQVLLVLLASKLFAGMFRENPRGYWILLDATLIFSYVMASIFISVNPDLQARYNSFTIMFMILLFFAVNICVVILFNQLSEFHTKKKRWAMSELRAEYAGKEMARVVETQEEMRRFRHDLDNQLSTAALLISNGNVEGGLSKLRAVTIPDPGAALKRYTGNPDLDAIIQLKVFQAEKKQITVSVTATEAPDLLVDPNDLTSIVANLMDNAIEAVEGLPQEQKRIEFSCLITKGHLVILVTNPFGHRLSYLSGELSTSKPASAAHGLGLKIVRDICTKYSGALTYDSSDGKFKAQATIKVFDV